MRDPSVLGRPPSPVPQRFPAHEWIVPPARRRRVPTGLGALARPSRTPPRGPRARPRPIRRGPRCAGYGARSFGPTHLDSSRGLPGLIYRLAALARRTVDRRASLLRRRSYGGTSSPSRTLREHLRPLERPARALNAERAKDVRSAAERIAAPVVDGGDRARDEDPGWCVGRGGVRSGWSRALRPVEHGAELASPLVIERPLEQRQELALFLGNVAANVLGEYPQLRSEPGMARPHRLELRQHQLRGVVFLQRVEDARVRAGPHAMQGTRTAPR